MLASISSIGVREATKVSSSSGRNSGSGRARRSTLPLGLGVGYPAQQKHSVSCNQAIAV